MIGQSEPTMVQCILIMLWLGHSFFSLLRKLAMGLCADQTYIFPSCTTGQHSDHLCFAQQVVERIRAGDGREKKLLVIDSETEKEMSTRVSIHCWSITIIEHVTGRGTR